MIEALAALGLALTVVLAYVYAMYQGVKSELYVERQRLRAVLSELNKAQARKRRIQQMYAEEVGNIPTLTEEGVDSTQS